MNWVWIKIKQGAWRIVLAVVAIITMVVFLYNLIRPSKDRTHLLASLRTNVKVAIKENEIRATLEKDKVGTIKKIYDRKLESIKKITDRESRLEALIRLHEELNL